MVTMNRTAVPVALLAALLASACSTSSTGTMPLAPSSSSGSANDAAGGIGGSSLKAGAPIAVSPLNNVTVSSLLPTLVASGGALTYGTGAVQYRFRVLDALGTITADSGLVTGASWTVPTPLTPTSKYTWMARSEFRGLNGPWSLSGSFTTPVAPGNDYGAWESTCAGRIDAPLVECVWNFVRPTNSFEDFEVVKRVAWLLRGQGGGLLLKGSGENVVPWMGKNFSASRVCFPANGEIHKIIGDAGPGGANSPGWGAADFVSPSTCLAAIDPRLR